MIPMKISDVAVLSVLYTYNDIATYYSSLQFLKILIFKFQYEFVKNLPIKFLKILKLDK